jgi:glycosyltransferase involved in cell wall biosynthesis
VSIILTVYKPRQYLEGAIKSILRQSFADFELIITDDANSEWTRQRCLGFGADRRVTYRGNPTRLGPLLNIAAALKQAGGEYVVVLNDDDEFEPGLLQSLIQPLLRFPECVLAFCDHWMVDSFGIPIAGLCSGTAKVARRQNLAEGLLPKPFGLALRGGALIAMGAMFRRNALRPDWFRPEAGGAYDLWLAIQLSAMGGFYYVPAQLMRYRVHRESESARRDPEKVQSEIFIFETLLKQSIPSSDHEFARAQLATYLFVLGRERQYSHNRKGACCAFLRSLQVKPSIKAALGISSTYFPEEILQLAVKVRRRASEFLSQRV